MEQLFKLKGVDAKEGLIFCQKAFVVEFYGSSDHCGSIHLAVTGL